MQDNELDKLMEEMYSCMDSESKVILDIINYEKLHKKRVVEKFPRYTLHFEHAFTLFVEWTGIVNYLDKKKWPSHRAIQFLLMKNSLGTFYSAYDRLLKGFYSDATILLRTNYETLIRILYISYFPKDPYRVFSSKKLKGQNNFNLTDFTKNTLKVKWDFIYHLSSSYAHSHTYETLKDVVSLSKDGQRDIKCFKLQYDEMSFSVPVNYTYFLFWGYLKIFILLFVDPIDKKIKQDSYKKLLIAEKAFGGIIKNAKNRWAVTFNDLENITSFIKNKENIEY